MKTEPTGAPSAIFGTGASHDAKTQRWLADLERAWLDASPKRGGASSERDAITAHDEAAAPGVDATSSIERFDMQDASSRVKVASTAPSNGSTGARAALPTAGGNVETAQSPRSPSDAVMSSHRLEAPRGADVAAPGTSAVAPGTHADGAVQASGMPGTFASTWPAQGTLHAGVAPQEIAQPPAAPAARLLAVRDVAAAADRLQGADDDEAATLAGAPADERAPDYAKRVLQVSGDEELQLNLRDAALQQAQHSSVALALFEQLHHAGMPLRRVYINGQRFEHGVPAAKPSSPIQIHPTTKE